MSKSTNLYTWVEQDVKKGIEEITEAEYVRPKFSFGCLKGILNIEDDFSDVLEDFKEYM